LGFSTRSYEIGTIKSRELLLLLTYLKVAPPILHPDFFYMVLKDTSREREGEEWVVREGVGAGGRNEPSLVCTYE
jgi:hypothetical protein